MPAETLWTLDRVSLRPGRLRDVTLGIRKGVTAVLGWSGAGKTSLLNVLVAFEKPDSGEMHGRIECSWVPHNDGLWPHCTVREHLTLSGSTDPGALLEKFDLSAVAQSRPPQLSQGERSRLSVARALAALEHNTSTRRVLVMDEPLTHVDPARVGRYWKVIRDSVTAGHSLIFSTHQPELVLSEAQRVICLHEGAVVFVGDVAELYREPESPRAMLLLGPGNWFTQADALHWLGEERSAPFCVRPEQLEVVAAEHAPHCVIRSRFGGSIAETELQSTHGETRTVFHRPPAPLAAGQHVRLLCV